MVEILNVDERLWLGKCGFEGLFRRDRYVDKDFRGSKSLFYGCEEFVWKGSLGIREERLRGNGYERE